MMNRYKRRTSTLSFLRAACWCTRTRGIYFADEPANASDPVLNSIKNKKRRQTLIASPGMENGKTVYRFDIRLQGDNETVFFDM